MGEGADEGGIATGAAPARGTTLSARISRRVEDLLGLVRPAGRVALRLRLAVAGEALADAMRRDLDAGLALPGLVVVFACGIAVYVLLPREPWFPAVAAVAAVAVVVTVVRRRRGHAARLAATVTALLLGMTAATLESLRATAPRLDHERTVTVEGRVSDLDATAHGGLRLTVDVTRMEGRGLTSQSTPSRITATLTAGGWRPDVGDGVRFTARLKPPEGPVIPGGYDFARRAWFDGRGAGGYVLGRARPVDLGPPSAVDRLLQPIGSLRHAIAERVRASLPGPTGTIAAALMVGEQRAIPEAVNEPLRASGLTHIVSISGLHMSLVAGGVIVAVRGILAFLPLAVLGFPIKKWAAAAALVTITVYLLLSGNQVAALRSHLMLSVALFAVMVDRPAITMHTVAVSAAAILAFTPSQALEPSFLMSYLAVIGLVASYDLHRLWASRRPPPRREEGLLAHLVGGGLRHVEGLAFSSLVAGLATAPVIAGVFFRGAPYSILANMAVLPVTGMVIMPAAVVAALAMPFGLDHWPLQVTGLGIEWMIAVGRWTAALPGGAGLIGMPHPATMPLGIAAVLWLSAWKSRVRLFGLVPAVAAAILLFLGPRPDVAIGRHGSPVAVRDAVGRLHLLAARNDRFDAAIWLAADSDPRNPADPQVGSGWTCDSLGCVFRLAPGTAAAAAPADPDADLVIAVVRHPAAFDEDCRRAAVVISSLVAPPGCRDHTVVIDRLDLVRGGATTLVFTGPTIRSIAAVDHDGPAARSGPPSPTLPPAIDRGPIDPTSPDDAPPNPGGSATAEEPSAAREPPASVGPLPDPDVAAEPPWPRRAVSLRRSLPRFARPWTPIDPSIDRLEADAATADAAARGRSAVEPRSAPEETDHSDDPADPPSPADQ